MRHLMIIFLMISLSFLPALPAFARCDTKPLTRKGLEEKLGEPVECKPENFTGTDINGRVDKTAAEKLSSKSVCYQNAGNNFSVTFDTGEKLTSLVIFADRAEFNRWAFSLIPGSWKGFQKKYARKALPIDSTYKFADDCVEFELFLLNYPRGSAPPGWLTINFLK